MRKPRKARKNPLQVRIRPMTVPPGVKAVDYVQTLLSAVGAESLPDGWDVDLAWRNPSTKKGRSADWQSGEFTSVIQDSHSGFATVVRRTLRRELSRLKQERLPRSKKAQREFMKRSLAARKGWETRWRQGKAVGAKGRKFIEQTKQKKSRKPAKKRKGRKKR